MADTIEKLNDLGAELESHGNRLRARADAIVKLAESQTDPGVKHLIELVGEGFREQVDTGLDFQKDTVAIVAEALEQLAGDEPGFEPEDAATILATLADFRAMLDEAIAALGADQAAAKAILQGKLERCIETIVLVEEITLEDGAEESEA